MSAHLPGVTPRVTTGLGHQAPSLPATDAHPARPGWAAVTLTVGCATVELTPRHAERVADALRRLAAMSCDGWLAPEPAASEPCATCPPPVAFHTAAPRTPSPADLAARRVNR